MKRREFLTGAAAAGLAAPATPKRVIDTHTHFYDPSRPQGVPWPPKDSTLYRTTLPPRYAQMTRELAVKGTIVVEASPWVEDNQWVLDLAKDNPIIVGMVGHLQPGTPDFKVHLKRFAANRLFRGIRIGGAGLDASLAKPGFVDDLQRLADAGLELDVNGSAAMFPGLVRLAARVSGLRIVINHLPYALPPAEPARGEAQRGLRELGANPLVYAKVSGILRHIGGRTPITLDLYQAALEELWELFGSGRVVYGSDWPVSERMGSYATVQQVAADFFALKGPDAMDRYFYRNSISAYRWA